MAGLTPLVFIFLVLGLVWGLVVVLSRPPRRADLHTGRNDAGSDDGALFLLGAASGDSGTGDSGTGDCGGGSAWDGGGGDSGGECGGGGDGG